MENQYFIQQLIESKSFDELSDKEMKKVLEVITEEEYRIRRKVVEGAKQHYAKGVENVQPSDGVLGMVAGVMKQREEQAKKPVLGIVFTKVPVYQVGIAALLLILLLPQFLTSEMVVNLNVPQPEKEVVYLTDTIEVEKEVPTIVEVEKVKYITIKESSNCDVLEGMNLVSTMGQNHQDNVIDKEFAEEQFQEQLKNIGQSASDREELNQFLVTSN